jgi:hypothetical protein
MAHEERMRRLECWIGNQTYNRGIFDVDAEFRPAWSHYHDLWRTYSHAWCPLTAVWVRWQQPDFEAARRRVVEIMIRVARLQPSPVHVVAKVLARTVPDASSL